MRASGCHNDGGVVIGVMKCTGVDGVVLVLRGPLVCCRMMFHFAPPPKGAVEEYLMGGCCDDYCRMERE